jgi:hypothetical protein
LVPFYFGVDMVKVALLGAQRLLDQRAEAGFRTRSLDTSTKVAAAFDWARQRGCTPVKLLAMYLGTMGAIEHTLGQSNGQRWR